MNADTLALIFDYSNKFELARTATTETGIVVHLSELSRLQREKDKSYIEQVEYFNYIIAELEIAFGAANVEVEYLDPPTHHTSGYAFVDIKGYISFDMQTSYGCNHMYFQVDSYISISHSPMGSESYSTPQELIDAIDLECTEA